MNMVAFSGQSLTCNDNLSPCLDTGGEHHNRGVHVAAFMENQRAELRISEQTDALACGGGKPGQGYPAALTGSTVRRLTPPECERLQGFPDDFTLVPYRGKPAADGPRYKALGNSMAVPVIAWIGRRIEMVEDASHPSLKAA
jgi:DNA (cytosine-5)-methyltransferase 1